MTETKYFTDIFNEVDIIDVGTEVETYLNELKVEDYIDKDAIEIARIANALVPYKIFHPENNKLSAIYETLESNRYYESLNDIFFKTVVEHISNEINYYDEGRLNNDKVFEKFISKLDKKIKSTIQTDTILNEMLIDVSSNNILLNEALNEGFLDNAKELAKRAMDSIVGSRELTPEEEKEKNNLVKELESLTKEIDILIKEASTQKDNAEDDMYATTINTIKEKLALFNKKSKRLEDLDAASKSLLQNLKADIKKNLDTLKQIVVDLSNLSVDNILQKIAAGWKWAIGMFKLVVKNLKNGWKELVGIFRNERFMKAMKTFANKLKKMVEAGAIKLSEKLDRVQAKMFKPFTELAFIKNWDRKIDEFNTFLSELESGTKDEILGYKIPDNLKKPLSYAVRGLKMVLGYYLAKMAYHIWTQMFFIGDPKYDFDFSAVLVTMAGKYSLNDWFSSAYGPTLFWYYLGIKHPKDITTCPPQCSWLGDQRPFGDFTILGEQISGNHVLMALITLIILLYNYNLVETLTNLIDALKKTIKEKFSFLTKIPQNKKAVISVAISNGIMKPGSGRLKNA